MPTAGEEGYEKLVICPYDRAHEIRQGRLQFHLDKCRKNFPIKAKEMVKCPFNSTHLIPKVEEQFHTEEECINRTNWDRSYVEVGDTYCPVKDLVSVNAATVPDGDENWDNVETPDSVLQLVKAQAMEKKIFRFLQCESKAKRKKFREEEKLRHESLQEEPRGYENTKENEGPSSKVSDEEKLPLPHYTKMFPGLLPIQQDRELASNTLESLDRQFKSLKVNQPSSSHASSLGNTPQLDNFPPLPSMSYAAASNHKVPLSPVSMPSRPSTAMSVAMSVASGVSGRNSSLSMDSKGQSFGGINKDVIPQANENKFCQIPVPGLGRGSRRRHQKS